ncbi:MAG: hypothetical protein AABX86_02035, partial [Nanoarchaeota archaeon]
KNEPVLRAVIGNQQSKDEEVAENAVHIYTTVLHVLPQEKNNIERVMIKYTMGPAVEIGNLPKIQAETKEVQQHGA